MSTLLSTEAFGPVLCPLCKKNEMVLKETRGESESWECVPCHFILSGRCVVAVPANEAQASELVEVECMGCKNVVETSKDDPYPLCEECSTLSENGGTLPKWVM